MFDEKSFSEILQKISNSYNSITEFSEKSEVNRTYLSKYINMKLNSPPTPKILEKIANSSNGIISYAQLMEVCGYLDITLDFLSDQVKQRTEYFFKNSDYLTSIGLDKQQLLELQNIINMDFSSSEYQDALDNFLSTLPLEISYEVLKFLQDMLFDLRVAAEEKMKLAHTLGEEVNELIEKAQSINELDIIMKNYSNQQNQFYLCPVYGLISAGQPNWAEQNIEGRIPVPMTEKIDDPENCFYLKVNGESMNLVVKNGAYALIHKQDMVENGEIAVVLVNGFDATLKKFKKQDNLIILEPMSNADDPNIQTQVYDKNTTIKILGKYIGKFEMN